MQASGDSARRREDAMSHDESGVDTERRRFIASLCTVGGALLLMPRTARALALQLVAEDVVIVRFADDGTRIGTETVPKVVKPEREWKQKLSPLAFEVTRHGATEYSFTGAYWNNHEKGLYRCICCENALFSSAHKFDSGTGWPSFWQPIAGENVIGPLKRHPAADETEVTCKRCDAHLGDIFDDGPRPTGLRYCIDSVALRFVKVG
jgi:peptide-methionine (R)-S-oxide reductase